MRIPLYTEVIMADVDIILTSPRAGILGAAWSFDLGETTSSLFDNQDGEGRFTKPGSNPSPEALPAGGRVSLPELPPGVLAWQGQAGLAALPEQVLFQDWCPGTWEAFAWGCHRSSD
jgi:hypothetical protein